MTSTFVLNTQMQNIKFRLLTLSIKSDAQKQMVESSFGHEFDLKYLEVGFFFKFLKFIVFLWASSQNFVEKHQFIVIISYIKQTLDSYLFIIIYLQTT
jgi:hypothetical protein